jgi:hypothetical protein
VCALVEEGEAVDVVKGGAKGWNGLTVVGGVIIEGGHEKGPSIRHTERFIRGGMSCACPR